MAKYRKKPIVIEATQWFFGQPPLDGMIQDEDRIEGYYVIPTLEGNMIVDPGDWVITGIDGEKYPCKPHIFDATDEVIKED